MHEKNAFLVADGFPKYVKYKSSGVDWLGEVPEHWKTPRFFDVLSLTKRTGAPQLPLLSVYLHLGVVRFDDVDERRTNATSDDLSGYQVVEKNEFVANNQQAWRGSVGVSRYRGIISPAYLVFECTGNYHAGYLNYLMRSESSRGQFEICSKGIGSIQRNLQWSLLKSQRTLLPPLAEQIQIVNFLDTRTKEIDKVIKQKQRTIALLEEYKHSLIERAVTKGLDPSVPMKDSGVDWLGEVPEHWSRFRLKQFLTATKKLVGDDWFRYDLLSLTLNGVILRDMENPEGKFPSDFSSYQVVKPGQIILCLFDVEETPRTVGLSSHQGMITGAYDVFDLEGINPRFFYYWYLSLDQHKKLKALYRGLRNTIPTPRLQGMEIFLPDSNQQQCIVGFLDTKIKEIEDAKSNIQVQINHLKEYKDSLIESAVTGKIKVA